MHLYIYIYIYMSTSSGIPKLNAEPEQKNLLKDSLGESLTSGMDVIAKALVMARSNKYAEVEHNDYL